MRQINIKKTLDEAGLTQSDFALGFRRDKTLVWKWYHQVHSMRESTIITLEQYFKKKKITVYYYD